MTYTGPNYSTDDPGGRDDPPDRQGRRHGGRSRINVATIDAHQNGILTTTNVIVPGVWFPEAVRMINANPGLDVGVHLALTSEWTNVKWRPLTHVPGLVDADGFFQPAVHPREGFGPGASLEESPWTLEQIEQELRAQLELALRHLPQATYTRPHMLFTRVDPSVNDLVSRLTAEYGLITPFDLGIRWVGLVYQGGDSGEVKAANLAARLETLEPGRGCRSTTRPPTIPRSELSDIPGTRTSLPTGRRMSWPGRVRWCAR